MRQTRLPQGTSAFFLLLALAACSARPAVKSDGGACATGKLSCQGICVDTASDPKHCGTCGNACGNDQVCTSGGCTLNCLAPWTACGGSCADTATNHDHCGTCGTTCGAQQVCSNGVCSDGCPTGQVKCGTTCVDPAIDLQKCGATAGCGLSGGSAGAACVGGQRCTAGQCTCPPSWLWCNSACVDPSLDRDRCGATACDNGAVCGVNQVCSGGACTLTCPAGMLKCNGICIDPKTDPAHCGAAADCEADGGTSGNTCAPGEVCSAGSCALSCQTGLVNCGGVCVDPNTDRMFCGATPGCGTGRGVVGTACEPGQVCNGGSCTVSCQPGLVKCGGVCTDPGASRAYCGASGNCTNVGAGNSAGTACAAGNLCMAGTCTILCPTGSVNCGGVCINPSTDNGHCGAFGDCTNVGAGNNAGNMCTQGQVCNNRVCSVVCPTGTVTCGGVCIDPSASRAYCGATGNCTNVGAGNSAGTACAAGNLCVAGTCTISCPTGSVNCGGVCINPSSDNSHCGAAGACSNVGAGNSAGSACTQGRVCNAGACAVICQTGLVNCGGVCIDPSASRAYCGATGNCTDVGAGNSGGVACAAGNLCVAGICTVSCPSGSVNCGGVCVNPNTDNSRCGAAGDCTNVGAGNSAGSVCSAGSTCTAGSCTASCSNGLHDCGNMCVDWTYNPSHCGGCGNACSSNHITRPTCFGSSCDGVCDTGYLDCDGSKLTNGCETNPLTDAANCGGCSVAGDRNCNRNATGGICTNGICSGAACNTGYANCDGQARNGCEAPVASDVANCGGCNTVCTNANVAVPATATCANSACTITTCVADYDNCDGNAANGCETKVTTDLANCGTCGNACGVGKVCVAGGCQPLTCSAPAALSSTTTPGYASITNYFPLNGTLGNIAHNASIPAAIGSNGTASNGNSGMTYVAGQFNQAMNLDGSNDTVDLGAAVGNFGTADLSIAMWLKTTPIGRTQWILTKRPYCNHSPFWNVGIASNGRLIWEVDQDYAGTNYGGITGATSITDNVWHHVAFIRQGTALRIYLDGNLDASGATSGVTVLMENYNVRIGQISCAAGQNFRGQLDDLAIWTGYALTLSDERLIACDGGH